MREGVREGRREERRKELDFLANHIPLLKNTEFTATTIEIFSL